MRVDYNKYPEEERNARALADCRDHFGYRYPRVLRDIGGAFKAGNVTREQAINIVNMVSGVAGYPATVLVDHAIEVYGQ